MGRSVHGLGTTTTEESRQEKQPAQKSGHKHKTVKKAEKKIRSKRRTSLGNKYWRGGEDVLEPRRQAW